MKQMNIRMSCLAGLFVALDMNCTWTDVAQLEKPAVAFVSKRSLPWL
jgi:hypothetical protein